MTKRTNTLFQLTNFATIVDADAATNAVIERMAEKTIATYELVADGKIKVTYDFIELDPKGNAIDSYTEREEQRRIAPFPSTEKMTQEKNRREFVRYMKTFHPGDI